MGRNIALLRGINISGKNKISMSDLKKGFEEIGFAEVTTYLNSGNVVFTSPGVEGEEFAEQRTAKATIEQMITTKFGFEIPVYVMPVDLLKDVLAHAPKWWGTDDKEKYHNLIFIISKDSAEDLCNSIGETTEGLERIEVYQNVIFWTFDHKAYAKCNWWKKTASAGIGEKLTIRTANTLKKLCK